MNGPIIKPSDDDHLAMIETPSGVGVATKVYLFLTIHY